MALYTKLGFRPRRRLVGYRWEVQIPEPSDPLEEIDLLELARIVAREGQPDLPWMLTAETLAAFAPPSRAFRLEDRAFAMVGDPAGGEARADRPRRRPRSPPAGVGIAPAERPVRDLRRPPVGDLADRAGGLAAGFFTRLGWERQPLCQWEMVLDLTSAVAP